MESDQRSRFLFGRIFFNEPDSTSSGNALDFWFGRIFCDEPVSTSSENALAWIDAAAIIWQFQGFWGGRPLTIAIRSTKYVFPGSLAARIWIGHRWR